MGIGVRQHRKFSRKLFRFYGCSFNYIFYFFYSFFKNTNCFKTFEFRTTVNINGIQIPRIWYTLDNFGQNKNFQELKFKAFIIQKHLIFGWNWNKDKFMFRKLYTGWVFYLETSKYLKKYASYERNVFNKNFLFPKGKSDSPTLPGCEVLKINF